MKVLFWRYPEWWTVALAAAAWVVMIEHGAHHHSSTTAALYQWFLMVVAMMFPAMVGPAHSAAIHSLWRRRHRAIAVMLFGYVAVWMLVGLAILAILKRSGLDGSVPAIAAGFAAAALWQLTPVKRWALKACHRSTPLAARGWRAEFDCLRYGCAMGGYCIASCGALMLACSLAGHSMAAMLSGTAIMVGERYFLRISPRAILAAISAVTGVYLVIAAI